MTEFVGAKAAFLLGNNLLTYLRDNRPGLPFAGMWDFPGGGREGEETPFECLARESLEEFSITIEPGQVLWQEEYPSMLYPDKRAYFFVVKISEDQIKGIKFGDEGQRWQLMSVEEFMRRDDAIGHLKMRLQDYFDSKN